MPERGHCPEIYFAQEYWDGHLPNRSCCKDMPSSSSLSLNQKLNFLSIIRENLKATSLAGKAWKELKDLLGAGQETAIQSFIKGDEFRGRKPCRWDNFAHTRRKT